MVENTGKQKTLLSYVLNCNGLADADNYLGSLANKEGVIALDESGTFVEELLVEIG